MTQTQTNSASTSGGAPAPSGSPVMRFFVPGLALGLVVGAILGAVVPTLVGADSAPLQPGGVRSPTQPTMTPAEREAAEAAAEELQNARSTTGLRDEAAELAPDAEASPAPVAPAPAP